MIRLLTFTTIFPNSIQPQHGVMVENRLHQLLDTAEVSTRVIAPVPWFPSQSARFGQYGSFAKVPLDEIRRSVPVHHPRFPVIPKVGSDVAPLLLAAATYRSVAREVANFDVIDAHYFYPDGVAAMLIAKRLGKPIVITARGSDINVFPQRPVPRQWIRWAANRCDAIITVSGALRDAIRALGIAQPRIVVLRNGVDLDRFAPLDMGEARKKLQWGPGRVLLSVGKLVEAKGHALVVEALIGIPDVRLVIVGAGPFRDDLRRLAAQKGVGDRVSLVGEVPHSELATFYSAADLSILASAREGMPNVVLESLACGTPVIATDVGGIGEIMTPSIGVLLRERTPHALHEAIIALLQAKPAVAVVRRHAEELSWKPVIKEQVQLYRDVLQRRQIATLNAGGYT